MAFKILAIKGYAGAGKTTVEKSITMAYVS